MGRVMAHAYADEQMKIAHQLQQDYLPEGDDMNDDLEYALEKQAHAWDLVKEAADMPKSMADRIALTRRQGGENCREMYRRQRDIRAFLAVTCYALSSAAVAVSTTIGPEEASAKRSVRWTPPRSIKTLVDDIKADRKGGYRDARRCL